MAASGRLGVEGRSEGVLRSEREERRSFQKPLQKALGTRTKHVSQWELLIFLQNPRHRGSTKQESTLPEESLYKFLLCPYMQGALIQKDSMLYEFTSSDGRLLFFLLGLRIAWYPGLSTPVGFVSPGSSSTSYSCHPISVHLSNSCSYCLP